MFATGRKATEEARCFVAIGGRALLDKPRILCIARAGQRRVDPFQIRGFGGSEELVGKFFAPTPAAGGKRLAALCCAFLHGLE